MAYTVQVLPDKFSPVYNPIYFYPETVADYFFIAHPKISSNSLEMRLKTETALAPA